MLKSRLFYYIECLYVIINSEMLNCLLLHISRLFCTTLSIKCELRGKLYIFIGSIHFQK